MPQPRLSTSLDAREVNVLQAMLQSCITGKFENPEDTATFQRTAQKVIRLSKRMRSKKKEDV